MQQQIAHVDVTNVYDDVTYVYDDVTYVYCLFCSDIGATTDCACLAEKQELGPRYEGTLYVPNMSLYVPNMTTI